MKTLYFSFSLFSKQMFFILLCGLFVVPLKAQNWPEPGATWEYCLNPPTVLDEDGTKTFAYTTDTTINDKSYAVIRHVSTNDQTFEAGTEYDYNHRVYVRTSNDTIYRNVNGVDHLFFINGLAVGDEYRTFRTALNNYNVFSCDPEIHLKVIDVSTIEIGGETFTEVLLEDTNFTHVYDDNFEGQGDVNPKYAFVEGVGLRNDFPFVFHLGFDAQNKGSEECYLSTDGSGPITLNKYSFEGQFIDFNECFSVSVKDQDIDGFSIFPNPVSEGFRVENTEVGNNTIQSLMLYNQKGQRVKSLNPQNSFHSLGTLPPGLYFLQIETADGFVWKKVVKE